MEKQFKLIFLIAACWLSAVSALRAQNIPDDNATFPPGSATTFPLPHAFDQGGNVAPSQFNYSRSWTPLVPMSDSAGFNLLTGYVFGASTVQVATVYSNGWGDPLLGLQHRADNLHDMATVYDNRASLTSTVLLQYPTAYANSHFQTDPYTTQKNFYLNQYPSEEATAYSLSKQTFSGGVQQVSTFSPGKSFVGQNRGQTTTAFYNTTADAVQIWSLNTAGQPVTNAIYADNQLVKTVLDGQHNTQTIQYVDKNQQLLCKKTLAGSNTWLVTYYVYDDLGRLRYVLTPKAVSAIAANGWQVNNSILSGLCFSYLYDKYGKIIQRGVPGKNGMEYTVYDKLFRPVLFQNPLLQQQGKWQFTIYDIQGNPVLSGVSTSANTQSGWQSQINTTSNPAAGSLLYYLINGFTGTYPASYTSFANSEIWEYSYYDTYDQDPALTGRAFDNSNSSAFLQGSQYLVPQASTNTYGKLTGKRTFIPGSNGFAGQWVNSVAFYDKEGRVIQTQTLNPFNSSGQWDITTQQYSFAGSLVMVIDDHYAWNGANKLNTKIFKRYDYDLATGRLKEIKQRIDADQTWHSITQLSYDVLGRISEKRLGGVEHQVLNYNIRGQLTDLNKDFVNYPNTSQTQDMTFGMSLSYDYGFTSPRYDGNISGFLWRGGGRHSPRRAYGYSYDPAGRMTVADFREFTLASGNPFQNVWNNENTDYSVSKLTYDENGNMLTMKQRGVDIGGTGIQQPVDIDDLNYAYLPNSNTLNKVEDAVSVNYHLEDFVNNNANSTDYSYDPNGNLASDANKGVTNISYNYLDLPLTVNTNTGTITNTYDASGTLLQKVITPVTGNPQVYRYWGGFTYRNDSLLYVSHEEGRSRWLADSNKFKYDFFIKDHLGNVRTTVTADEGGTKEYLATYEVAAANTENLLFEGVEEHRAPKPGSTSSSDVKAALLNGEEADKRIGTSILIRVMAGDKFNASAYHFYENEGDNNVSASSQDMLGSIIGALTSGSGSSPAGGEGSAGSIVDKLFNPANYADIYDGLKEQATDPNLPRAYLNYIVFDENMRIVREQSGALQVNSSAGNWQQISLPTEITVGQNGYLAVYISNEQHKNVFFDYLDITYYRGRLLEEQHYYPHGLAIRAGSNTPLPNKHLYQGKLLQDELGLNLYDFHARQYDPQIGRFWGIDPADQFPSGYTGMANDPANNIDPTGMQAGNSAAVSSSTIDVTGAQRPGQSEVGWQTSMGSWEAYLPLGWEKPSAGSGNVKVVYASEMRFSTAAKVKSLTGWHGSKGFGFWEESFKGHGKFAYTLYDDESIHGDFLGANEKIAKWTSVASFSKRFNYPSFYQLTSYSQINDAPFPPLDYEKYLIPLPPVFRIFGWGGRVVEAAAVVEERSLLAAEEGTVKYLGRMEDLEGISRNQTILDELAPSLGSPKADYYRNMSVIRKNLRDGVIFKDASWFRPNSELAPTFMNPNRTVGQTFFGAERNLMTNKGLWP